MSGSNRSSVTASKSRSWQRASASAPVRAISNAVAGSCQRTRDQLAIAIVVLDDSTVRAPVRVRGVKVRETVGARDRALARQHRVERAALAEPRCARRPMPPCASTSRRVSASPRPVPWWRFAVPGLELLELDEQPAEIRGRDADAGVLDLEAERVGAVGRDAAR